MISFVTRTAALALLLVASAASGQTRYTWVGGASGAWSEATNWSPNGVPGAADTAAVSIDDLGIRTAILTAHTTVAGLEIYGLGVIAGDFDLTVTDRFLWSGSDVTSVEAFQGTGTVTVAPDATLFMTEPVTRFRVTGGRTLVNDGLIVWDGIAYWDGQGRLVNNGELVFAQPASSDIAFANLDDAFTNSASGVIRYASPGTGVLGLGMVNDGLIRVEQGVLDFGGFNTRGVRGSGSVEVDTGATLLVTGGVHVQTSLTGDAATFRGGNLAITDDYDITTTRFDALLGTLQINGTGTVETLELGGGELLGSGDLTVSGSLTWTDGVMGGSGTTTLGPAVPLTIGGDERISVNDTRTLRTEGDVTWTGEADLSSNTGTASFEVAGTLTSSGPGERTFGVGPFTNTGTVVHDGGTLRFFSTMTNGGEMRIEDGLLYTNSHGTDTGRYRLGETGRLELGFGTRTLASGAEIVGTGTVAFTGGTVTNQATWRPGPSSGTLTREGAWPAPTPEAVLDMEVGGSTPGAEHDQLAVTGTAALGGTLRVTLTDGFTPSDGDRFLLIAASGGATGSFDAVEIPTTSPAGYVQATTEGVFYGLGTPVAGEASPDLPTVFALHAPAPNPARGSASLAYDLPLASPVRLAVFDALGREVAVLVESDRPAGTHTAAFDLAALPAGLYLVRLDAKVERATRALTVVR